MRRPLRQKLVGGGVVVVTAALMLAGSEPVPSTPPATPAAAATTPQVERPAATATVVATPTATATATVPPTRTPTPTATRTPTPRPSPTPTATPTPGPTSTPAPTPTLTPDALEAVAAVLAYDPLDPATQARLDQIVDRGGDVIPALAYLLVDDDPVRRWAALYVIVPLVRTEQDIAVLRPALNDPIPGFRVYAAVPLASRGVVEALPVLIEGLTLQETLPYGESPGALAQVSRLTLEFYTGESFADAAEWSAWWERVRADISWAGAGYEVAP
jgi:hypothetical protein